MTGKDPSDAERSCQIDAWRALLETHSELLGLLERELEEKRGLPLNQYEVLAHLEREDGGRMRMQDLARSLLLSKSGVTRLIDRMVYAGLVERTACETDRRVTYAQITRAGSRALRDAAPVHLRGIEEHFARHLSSAEANALTRSLSKVLEANRSRPSV